jgi:hypothetical protein
MILSALLTSVGINLGLCLLYITLYSVLRKQPGNAYVYAPRLVAEGKSKDTSDFNLERFIPSTGWVKRALQVSEEELLSIAGFDAFVFIRMFIFSLRVFSFAAIIGVFVLIPINYLGNQLKIDFSDLQNKSVDSFSISNVDDGSKWLWIHFSAAYVFTAFVCYLLYYEYNYISLQRTAYFYSLKPQPNQFTVVVRSIPISSGSTFSESVDNFFREFYPLTYLSHTIVRRTSKIQALITDADKIYRRLTHLKTRKDGRERQGRDGWLGIFGKKVDLVDHHEKRLGNVEVNLKKEQSIVAGKEVPAAFVYFKSRFGAAIALHMRQGENPTQWLCEPAPEPRDIHWPFFSASFFRRWMYNLVVIVTCIVVTLLFLIPVIFVQGLTNLDQLEKLFPFLSGILRIAVVSQVITGYLPSFILKQFLSFVPPLMMKLSSIQGYIAHSQIEKSACAKVLFFTIWNIFFANVLSGSALSRIDKFLEPKEIPAVLASVVPGQASFFIAYTVTSGWADTSSELFQMFTLIYNFIKRRFTSEGIDEVEVPSVSYHAKVPKILFFGVLGITYFFLAPLILPFLLVYYFLGYLIYRNQLLNVYSAKFESGGKFWPIVHNSTIFALMLMQVIAIGLFGLKKLPLAASLMFPLLIATLVFNSYCQSRFRPIFHDYSVQSLIRKDREDEDKPIMDEFCQNLGTAYEDPDLTAVRRSRGSDDLNSPLLQSA